METVFAVIGALATLVVVAAVLALTALVIRTISLSDNPESEMERPRGKRQRVFCEPERVDGLA